MTKPIVLLDVDEPCAQLDKLFREECLELGIELPVNPWCTLDQVKSRSEEEHRALVEHCIARRNASIVEPTPGAIEAVQSLRKVSRVVFVTSPFDEEPTWCHDRTLWLKKYFDALKQDIVYTSSKWLIRGDILIDDRSKFLDPWAKTNPDKFPLQWDFREPNTRKTWEKLLIKVEGIFSSPQYRYE